MERERESSKSSFRMSASNMYRTGDYVYVDAGPVRCLLVHGLDLNLFYVNFPVLLVSGVLTNCRSLPPEMLKWRLIS